MKRILLLLAAAALLPACDRRTREDVRVTVSNEGTETVLAVVEVDRGSFSDLDDDDLIPVSSSSTWRYDNVRRVSVKVYRTSDNELLFVESWDAEDLDDLDDLVFITVSP